MAEELALTATSSAWNAVSLLHGLERRGYLKSRSQRLGKLCGGCIEPRGGRRALAAAKSKVRELFGSSLKASETESMVTILLVLLTALPARRSSRSNSVSQATANIRLCKCPRTRIGSSSGVNLARTSYLPRRLLATERATHNNVFGLMLPQPCGDLVDLGPRLEHQFAR